MKNKNLFEKALEKALKRLNENEKRYLNQIDEAVYIKHDDGSLHRFIEFPLTKNTINYILIGIKDFKQNKYDFNIGIEYLDLIEQPDLYIENNIKVDEPIDVLINEVNIYKYERGVIYKNIDGHGDFQLLCYYDRKSNKKEYYLNPNDKEMANQDYYNEYTKNIKLDFKPGELDESKIKIDNSRRDFDMIFKDIVSDMTNEELKSFKEQLINSNIDKKTIELIDKEIENK